MHVLDFIMFFPCAILLWWFLGFVTNQELTQELGALGGIFFEIVFLVVYMLIFVWPIDKNWVDIFAGGLHINLVW